MVRNILQRKKSQPNLFSNTVFELCKIARALNSTAISKYVTLKMTDVPSKHVWKIKESCYVYTTVFGVFLKIDTRSHELEKQNAIDMQTQSAKRNKNSSSRHSPFYKGTIHIDKPSRQKCFVVNPKKIDENSQFWTNPISNHART